MQKLAVLGAGSWGSALAGVLASKGLDVSIWARRNELAAEINTCHTNEHYLPNIKLANNIKATADIEQALYKCDLIVLSIPTQNLRSVLRMAGKLIPPNAILVNTAKGLEVSSLQRLSEVVSQELPDYDINKFTALSGPSHAEEVALNLPTAVVAACNNPLIAEMVQDAFITPRFRVYTNYDLAGVEIAGALKNIIALGTGISDGLKFGDNAKAALMTRGLAEIARLGMQMGADPHTFAGLAGIGDLIVTCTSMHSRNRRAGIKLGEGQNLDDILRDMGMVVEGVKTCVAANEISKQQDIEMPITSTIYAVLYEGLNPMEAVSDLMERDKRAEKLI